MRPTVHLLRQWMDQSVEAADVTQDVGGKRCRSTFKFSKFTRYFHVQIDRNYSLGWQNLLTDRTELRIIPYNFGEIPEYRLSELIVL
jgi:hypothetical protein